MDKINERLSRIREEKRIGLMTHVVVGYPSLPETELLVTTMAEAGVDFVELQIPFSDPIADGPTIMHACEESLRNGTKVADAFVLAKKMTQKLDIPILFMGYFNTVFKYGVKKFCEDAAKAGISGLIIPDFPLEEEPNEHLLEYCGLSGLINIPVISPASNSERLVKNAAIAEGFVYCTSRQGTTGAGTELDPKVVEFLKRAKSVIKKPLAVGFGISTRQHVRLLEPHAEIAVVGSAVLDIVKKSGSNMEKEVATFLRTLLGK